MNWCSASRVPTASTRCQASASVIVLVKTSLYGRIGARSFATVVAFRACRWCNRSICHSPRLTMTVPSTATKRISRIQRSHSRRRVGGAVASSAGGLGGSGRCRSGRLVSVAIGARSGLRNGIVEPESQRGGPGGRLAEILAAADGDPDQERGERRRGSFTHLVGGVAREIQQRAQVVVVRLDVGHVQFGGQPREPGLDVHPSLRSARVVLGFCCQDDPMGRVTTRHPVLHLGADSARQRIETLAVEEPLEIRLDGSRFVVTMRTPGHDVDLVHGLLHAEGVIAAAEDVRTARYCAGADDEGRNSYNVMDVRLAATATPEATSARSVVTSSACGICGTDSIEQL